MKVFDKNGLWSGLDFTAQLYQWKMAVIACACAMRIDFENIARHSCYIKVD